MTARGSRPGAGARRGNAEIVNFAARAAGRVGYKRLASAKVTGARVHLGMTPAEFAVYLTAELGWEVTVEALDYWEDSDAPPGDLLAACEAVTGDSPEAVSQLYAVPHSFAAEALAGYWVTAYEFTHAGKPMFHVDIALVEAVSERRVRAVNHPPQPRTQGRAYGFRNEIEAELASRHLVGTWKNVSDTRYFGAVELAVLPGEAAMEGIYTGFASDVSVSSGPWKWIRLDPPSLPGDLTRVTMREPAAVYETVMTHSGDNGPLTLADIGEETE